MEETKKRDDALNNWGRFLCIRPHCQPNVMRCSAAGGLLVSERLSPALCFFWSACLLPVSCIRDAVCS